MSQSIQHIKRSNSNNRMETRSSGDFLIFSQQRIAIVCQARHVDSPNQSGCAKAIQVCKSLMRCSSPRLATVERAGPPAATLWILRRPLWREPGPSGDNARRSPVCSLWILRRPLWRELGPQRRQRAPQPLLQSLDTAPATVERAGPPAATTRAAAPSAVSADCAGHCGESRAPSGDNARRSPCCSLWILRRPLWREPGPQQRQRAPQPLLQSLQTAPLWTEPGPQRRQRAPQPLLQSLDTAPATVERAGPPGYCAGHCGQSRASSGENVERAGPPAATTCAAAPSAVSGYCAGHSGESRAPRAAAPSAVSGYCAGHCGESRAPSGDNARRSPFCSLDCAGHCGQSRVPSGDNARRSPFCSLWILRRPLWREPGPQQRQRAPQPLLQSLQTAPATVDRAGPQRRQRAPQPLLQSLDTAPATVERAGPPGYCAGHCGQSRAARTWREPGPQRRQRAPQLRLQSLDTAPATVERAGPPAATTRAAAPSAVSGYCAGHCGESRAPSGDNARRSPFCSHCGCICDLYLCVCEM